MSAVTTDRLENDMIHFKTGICRGEFPAFEVMPYGKKLIYLDSAASAQKPKAVIDAVSDCYAHHYANVHRGSHFLSNRATEIYEGARLAVKDFINARAREEIIFTRNATEAINLVAYSLGEMIEPGQAIIISEMEHHSNMVPWQMLCKRRGIELRIAPVEEDGRFLVEKCAALLDEKVALVAITHVSNVLGTIVNIKDLSALAHQAGAKILIDGSQAAPHMPIDVQDFNVDFYVFTGHKIYGPSGIGVLYGRSDLLEEMPPFLGGGEMISSVSFEKPQWASLPYKFEAGTPPIAQAAGLHEAIDFIKKIGFQTIMRHENALCQRATVRLKEIDGMHIIGEAPEKAAVVSFVIEGMHPHDAALLIDQQGVALRAGFHCAEPLLRRFRQTSSLRASFGLYNNEEDIDALIIALEKAKKLLV